MVSFLCHYQLQTSDVTVLNQAKLNICKAGGIIQFFKPAVFFKLQIMLLSWSISMQITYTPCS